MCRERPCTLRRFERNPEREIPAEGHGNAIPHGKRRAALTRSRSSLPPLGLMLILFDIANQQWPTLRRYVERVVAAVNAATPGSYTEVDKPLN